MRFAHLLFNGLNFLNSSVLAASRPAAGGAPGPSASLPVPPPRGAAAAVLPPAGRSPEPGGRRAHLAARGRSRNAGLSVVARAAASRPPGGRPEKPGGLSLRSAPGPCPRRLRRLGPPFPASSAPRAPRRPGRVPRASRGPFFVRIRARTQRRGLGVGRAPVGGGGAETAPDSRSRRRGEREGGRGALRAALPSAAARGLGWPEQEADVSAPRGGGPGRAP